jgi:hypothetical protein
MSDQEQPKQRPEPVLQPMRVVHVDGPQALPFNPTLDIQLDQSAPGQAPARTPLNPTGKKLNMSKREIEAVKRFKAKAPQAIPIKSEAEILESNARRIDDLDRNTRTGITPDLMPKYDYDWLESVGGKHVSTAWLQTAISISGFVNSESTFAYNKIKGMTMSWFPDGLMCIIDNSSGIKEIFVPSANVKCLVFE